MASTATITAKHGAGVSTTALVLNNVLSFSFDCNTTACLIRLSDGSMKSFAGYSTVTVTKSGNDFTLTLT